MRYFICLFLALLVKIGHGQQQSFTFNTSGTEELLNWYQEGMPKGRIKEICTNPTLQIVDQLYQSKMDDSLSMKEALFQYQISPYDDSDKFGFQKAFSLADSLQYFQNIIVSKGFDEEISDRALLYFPDSFKPKHTYEIFLTPCGWKWGDAMQFTYSNTGDQYQLSSEGTPAIIFNIRKVFEEYGNNNRDRIHVLKNVMAHEFFHILFQEFTSTNWNIDTEDFCTAVLSLQINEGIAHYIAEKDRLNKPENTKKLQELLEKNIKTFQEKADIIFDKTKSMEERRNAASTRVLWKILG